MSEITLEQRRAALEGQRGTMEQVISEIQQNLDTLEAEKLKMLVCIEAIDSAIDNIAQLELDLS